MNNTEIENVINGENIKVDDKYIEMQRIEIHKISYFFSVGVLKKLVKLKITNLGQFFSLTDLPNLINYSGSYIYDELMGTAKILKCKYLGIDPMIDENDDELLNDQGYSIYGSYMYVQKVLGLSSRAAKAICDNYRTLKKFFLSIRNNKASSFIKSLGKCTQSELVAKIQVIIDYHDIKNLYDNSNCSNNLISLQEFGTLQEKLRLLITKKNIIDKKLEEYSELVNEKIIIEQQIENIFLYIGNKLNGLDLSKNIK